MAAQQTKLKTLIEEEVGKIRGKAVPIRAGAMERWLTAKFKIPCRKLHPNPNDEFCLPEVGPNEEIVSAYEKEYRKLLWNRQAFYLKASKTKDPIIAQKIHPDGYMILNGHHRWAAAVRCGLDRLPVKVVNLTQEKDLKRMLAKSKQERLAALDLEEIVLSPDRDGRTEKPPRFPFRRAYREPMRLGIPALFARLATLGYDVWLYSSGYESVDYVRGLMRAHHTRVAGILTGTARKVPKDNRTGQEIRRMLTEKYPVRVHLTEESVTVVDRETGKIREIPLKGEGTWAAEVIEAMEKIGG